MAACINNNNDNAQRIDINVEAYILECNKSTLERNLFLRQKCTI